MTFTSFFSNKEKTKYNKASSRLSPHLEAEKTITIESKEKIDKLSNHNNNYSSTFNESPSLSNLATNLNYNNDDDNNSELTARPNNSSVDNISAKTITNESNEKQDKLSNNKNKNSISNKSSSLSSLTTSLNYNNNNNNNPENSDSWVNRKSTSSESGSLRSLKSLPPTPTSLYRPDSLGPLTINQKKLMDFLLDFQSRIFCCYRKEYPPIEPSFHTTDTGWGFFEIEIPWHNP
ncbi:7875_t:CDS:2 [Entrophospora sp. SA101]|nr:7875_t:CDS:2 [Entrophospora sp. SA101]